MAKPKADLGAMSVTVSKAAAISAKPFQALDATITLPQKSLTVKLDHALYMRLRDYASVRESHGDRATHQAIMVEALELLLGVG